MDSKKKIKKKDKQKLCQRCDTNPALPQHPCPYNEDINNCSDNVCNCCDKCAYECAMDI